jgi:hypothetical protein
MSNIRSLFAREILDSRGNPTIGFGHTHLCHCKHGHRAGIIGTDIAFGDLLHARDATASSSGHTFGLGPRGSNGFSQQLITLFLGFTDLIIQVKQATPFGIRVFLKPRLGDFFHQRPNLTGIDHRNVELRLHAIASEDAFWLWVGHDGGGWLRRIFINRLHHRAFGTHFAFFNAKGFGDFKQRFELHVMCGFRLSHFWQHGVQVHLEMRFVRHQLAAGLPTNADGTRLFTSRA